MAGLKYVFILVLVFFRFLPFSHACQQLFPHVRPVDRMQTLMKDGFLRVRVPVEARVDEALIDQLIKDVSAMSGKAGRRRFRMDIVANRIIKALDALGLDSKSWETSKMTPIKWIESLSNAKEFESVTIAQLVRAKTGDWRQILKESNLKAARRFEGFEDLYEWILGKIQPLAPKGGQEVVLEKMFGHTISRNGEKQDRNLHLDYRGRILFLLTVRGSGGSRAVPWSKVKKERVARRDIQVSRNHIMGRKRRMRTLSTRLFVDPVDVQHTEVYELLIYLGSQADSIYGPEVAEGVHSSLVRGLFDYSTRVLFAGGASFQDREDPLDE